jgi:hypothetical protein
VYTCNSSTQETEAGGSRDFKTSLSFIVRLCLKKQRKERRKGEREGERKEGVKEQRKREKKEKEKFCKADHLNLGDYYRLCLP